MLHINLLYWCGNVSELCSNHKTGEANQILRSQSINQHGCTRKQTQIKSATGPVKSQIFAKGFVNRFQIIVTINYTSYLFFILERIL